MSDPLKSADIEDVLSSIRRLVSEDSRLKAEPPRRPQADRLVLTPALRVPDSQPEISQVEDEPEDDTADQEAAEAAGQDAAERDDDIPEHEPQLTDDLADTDESALQADTDDAQMDETAQADEAECGVIAPEDEELGEAPDEARVQAAQASIDAIVEQAVRDATSEALGEDEVAQDSDDDTLEWEDHTPDAAEPAIELSEEADEVGDVQDAAQAAEDAAADLAGDDLDADTGETDPDEAVTTAEAAPEWSGTLYEAAARAGMEADAPADGHKAEPRKEPEQAESFDFLGGDEPVLDEEALRELVADIVRQELQGALGERITRNVRKLVRREIHRALSAQEFD